MARPFRVKVGFGGKARESGKTSDSNRRPGDCHRLHRQNACRPAYAARLNSPRPAAASPNAVSLSNVVRPAESLCDEVLRSVQIATLPGRSIHADI